MTSPASKLALSAHESLLDTRPSGASIHGADGLSTARMIREGERYFLDWWNVLYLKWWLKHSPCDNYWLLDTTACPLPVREVDADNSTRTFVHLPLFVYGEGLTDEALLCKEGEQLAQDDVHIPHYRTQDCRWQHLRLRTGSSEDSTCIARAAVFSHPCRFEIWDVEAEYTWYPSAYKAQGAGAAIVVSAVLHGMACAVGVSLGSLRTDGDIEDLVDQYERLRGGQSVALFSGVTTLAFYSRLGFRLERPQERFQAASKPYLYERQLPKALDSIASYTREPEWRPVAARQQPSRNPIRRAVPSYPLPCVKGLDEEVERDDVARCLDTRYDPGLLARNGVKWPLPVGIRARFRSGQATQEDCQVIEWVLDCKEFGVRSVHHNDLTGRRYRRPAGWLYEDYTERVAALPGCQDYLEVVESGQYWTAAHLLTVQKELWAQGRQHAQELASSGSLRHHPADEYCFANGQRPAVRMVLNTAEFKNVVLARRPANAITVDVAGGGDRLQQQHAYDARQRQQRRQEQKCSLGDVDDARRQELWDQHASERQFVLPVSNGFELLAE